MLAWLNDEPRNLRGHLLIIGKLLLFAMWWGGTAMILLDVFGLTQERREFEGNLTRAAISDPFRIWSLIAWIVIEEEITYRIIPLVFAIVAARRFNQPWIIAIAVVLSIAMFGWIHGGVQFIFVQGIGIGLPFCLIFLKCGGMRGGWGFVKASWIVIATHLVWNVFVFLVQAMRLALL